MNKIYLAEDMHLGRYVMTMSQDKHVYNFRTGTYNYKEGYSVLEQDERLIIPSDSIQQLADELYRLNIYPTELKDSENVMSEKDKHLQDMRKIVEKQLKIKF